MALWWERFRQRAAQRSLEERIDLLARQVAALQRTVKTQQHHFWTNGGSNPPSLASRPNWPSQSILLTPIWLAGPMQLGKVLFTPRENDESITPNFKCGIYRTQDTVVPPPEDTSDTERRWSGRRPNHRLIRVADNEVTYTSTPRLLSFNFSRAVPLDNRWGWAVGILISDNGTGDVKYEPAEGKARAWRFNNGGAGLDFSLPTEVVSDDEGQSGGSLTGVHTAPELILLSRVAASRVALGETAV